jgi:hypothetical protein
MISELNARSSSFTPDPERLYSLGRSSGAGSLSIWTHKLGGMNFTDDFVADGCSGDKGIPAVTLGAATQWYGTSNSVHARIRNMCY